MKELRFPEIYDNEKAHSLLKVQMKQHKILNIQMDDEPNAGINCSRMARLRYRLNRQGFQWILNYLQTGDYEDFGVFPSKLPIFRERFQETVVKELIEQGCNIVRVPFLRETQSYIKLIGLFSFGKLFFNIKRNDNFAEYLFSKGL